MAKNIVAMKPLTTQTGTTTRVKEASKQYPILDTGLPFGSKHKVAETFEPKNTQTPIIDLVDSDWTPKIGER